MLIPVYNHEAAIAGVVTQLQARGLPIILINDGSRASCRRVLSDLAANSKLIRLVELPENRGKGGAIKAGLRFARQQSYTHALQIDADGQHAVEDIEQFLEAGQRYPAALISGLPVYDESIPASRYYGRYLTHFWVMVNTLSRQIKDSMCGFRLYPVVAIMQLLEREFTGNRMDFDTEIMVRWVWAGGEIVHIPTKVCYPPDGVSHFQVWRDNLLITKMHIRLFFGMLWRLPRLVKMRVMGR
ncbi:MAG: glycosyltransferase family 2 protein [Cellvibrionaceae bacterium]